MDAETDAATAAAATAAAATAAATVVKPKLADLITEYDLQDEVNAMMSQNRKKLTTQNAELVTQLEELKRNSALTSEQKDELSVRITQLEEQYLTTEELSKRETNKQQKEHSELLTKSEKTSNRWKELYSSSTIDRALQDAAVEGEALHPSQIVDLLSTKTQIAEVIENGQTTGRYLATVKFNDVDADGKNVVLDLSPQDAIKRMKELTGRFGNLFKGTSTGGVGGSGGVDGSTQPRQKLQDLLDDPVKYAKWRKENPDLDISKLDR